jgi:hypothetical protein
VNHAGLRLLDLLRQPLAEVLGHAAEGFSLLAEDAQELDVSLGFGAIGHRVWPEIPNWAQERPSQLKVAIKSSFCTTARLHVFGWLIR